MYQVEAASAQPPYPMNRRRPASTASTTVRRSRPVVRANQLTLGPPVTAATYQTMLGSAWATQCREDALGPVTDAIVDVALCQGEVASAEMVYGVLAAERRGVVM